MSFAALRERLSAQLGALDAVKQAVGRCRALGLEVELAEAGECARKPRKPAIASGKMCEVCGKRPARQRFCSRACSQRAWMARKAEAANASPGPTEDGAPSYRPNGQNGEDETIPFVGTS
jgi:hypothetical protein